MRTVEELEALLDEKTRYADGAAELVASLTRQLELAEAELVAVKRERDEWRDLAETRGAILGDMTP